MGHFFNTDFQAFNVLEVDVDESIINEFLPILSDVYENNEFCIEDPGWPSDIKWISPNNLKYFEVFKEKFDRLNVVKHVERFLDFEVAPRLYMAFFVTRSFCREPYFHCDWTNTNNNAFTFLSPMVDEENGIGLIYRRIDGTIAEYNYRKGKALIFGDKFSHSTRPGSVKTTSGLLSFAFGSDKMTYWDQMSRTVASQGNLCRRPDGSFIFSRIN